MPATAPPGSMCLVAVRTDRVHVLVAGGGVAALEAMVALRALAGELVEVQLLSPDRDFFYRPLATGEPFGLGGVVRFNLAALARGCGARHSLGSLVAVRAAEQRVWTSRNAAFDYDVLVIAVGARQREAVPGALTFRGETDIGRVTGLLEDIDHGLVRSVAFALPDGVTWPLPLYELALLTADHLEQSGRTDVKLTVVTPESVPLSLLGGEASAAVARLLDERRIGFRAETHPAAFSEGELAVVPEPAIAAEAVVTLPRLRGVPLAGVPKDEDDFVHVDAQGRVPGLEHVYAAGDVTTFPIKQGGLAAQQADVVAEAIAANAGAEVTPRQFEPVLRGLVLSSSPLFVRAEPAGGGEVSTAAADALWWPAAKIASRYLSPYLAEHAGLLYGRPGGAASPL